MSHSGLLGPLDRCESPGRREQIRSHMRLVMEQLEEVLTELKDVARELREVVSQIDKLTSDIDLDIDADESTMPCSTCSSDRGMGDFFQAEVLSNNCELGHLLDNPLLDAVLNPKPAQQPEPDLDPGQRRVPMSPRTFCQMNGGDLPTPNGPFRTPYSPKASWNSGAGEDFSDKALYHALCCDDDDDYEEESGGMRSSRLSSNDSVFSSSPPRPLRVEALTPKSARKNRLSLSPKKKTLRNCSTQTASDKSTQTVLPYVPGKQRASTEEKDQK